MTFRDQVSPKMLFFHCRREAMAAAAYEEQTNKYLGINLIKFILFCRYWKPFENSYPELENNFTSIQWVNNTQVFSVFRCRCLLHVTRHMCCSWWWWKVIYLLKQLYTIPELVNKLQTGFWVFFSKRCISWHFRPL